LTTLDYLTFADNELKGSIPSELVLLTSLQTLDLGVYYTK